MRRTLAAMNFGWTQSRPRSIPVLGTPWATLALVLGIALLAHLALPDFAAGAILNPMGASVGVAAVAGLRRSASPSAWNLLAAGVAVYAVADLAGLLSASAAIERAATPLYLASYAAFSAGFALFATHRR